MVDVGWWWSSRPISRENGWILFETVRFENYLPGDARIYQDREHASKGSRGRSSCCCIFLPPIYSWARTESAASTAQTSLGRVLGQNQG